MWDAAKQRQFDDLRRRDEAGLLTSAEELHLVALLDELDREELEQLRPSFSALEEKERELRVEHALLRTEQVALADLARRYEDWLARARRQVADLLREREALRAEYEHVSR